jgi:uncharacterized membrane protein
MKDYTNKVMKDCFTDELLHNGQFPSDKFVKSIFCSLGAFVLLTVLLFNIPMLLSILLELNNIYLQVVIIVLMIIIVGIVELYPTVTVIKYIVLLIRFKIDPSTRTSKGDGINHKLEGLKIYLRDFGSLDQKTKSDVVLWNDYLIYSVMFGDNKKILDEYKKYVVLKGGE